MQIINFLRFALVATLLLLSHSAMAQDADTLIVSDITPHPELTKMLTDMPHYKKTKDWQRYLKQKNTAAGLFVSGAGLVFVGAILTITILPDDRQDYDFLEVIAGPAMLFGGAACLVASVPIATIALINNIKARTRKKVYLGATSIRTPLIGQNIKVSPGLSIGITF